MRDGGRLRERGGTGKRWVNIWTVIGSKQVQNLKAVFMDASGS